MASGCYSSKLALDDFVAVDLPHRAAQDYATLPAELRGGLVLRDAAAACSVAVWRGKKAAGEPSCRCAHAQLSEWEERCRDWFGD